MIAKILAFLFVSLNGFCIPFSIRISDGLAPVGGKEIGQAAWARWIDRVSEQTPRLQKGAPFWVRHCLNLTANNTPRAGLPIAKVALLWRPL
ncbi:hypothetical protein [Gluconobacter sp. Dm-44]|uniref:hypothetical protein n=1 Tax=Gluconobacter sp. Dm-44 TaxID=2799805 RepID=UPI002013043A|nr:hypothetical protein [Gluconobacter sp. Dm-44]